MIKIISFKICPFVQRVTAALEAKAISYEIDYIDLSHKPKWFLDLSPTGQVPLLITENGKALFESDALIEYIDEVYGPLQPNLPLEEKAFDRAWSSQASKYYLTQCSTLRSPNQKTLKERTEKLGKAFERAENQLGKTSYFKGDQLSKVDIAWLPLLHRSTLIEKYTGYDLIKNYPRVKNWQIALMKLSLITQSVSEDFEQKFTEFYLSNKTYLGSIAEGP